MVIFGTTCTCALRPTWWSGKFRGRSVWPRSTWTPWARCLVPPASPRGPGMRRLAFVVRRTRIVLLGPGFGREDSPTMAALWVLHWPHGGCSAETNFPFGRPPTWPGWSFRWDFRLGAWGVSWQAVALVDRLLGRWP